MKRLIKLTLIFTLMMFAVVGCGATDSSSSTNSYKDISVDEAYQAWQDKAATFIDVREPDEYAAGHIPGSVLIPLGQLEGKLSELDKNGKYVIVCRSGNRSSQASQLLSDNGFTNVANMTGGMLEWSFEVE